MKKRNYNSGDTLVEVLIVVAIISLILAGAFLLTRSSQAGVRDSQEHTEALKLDETQLEQLRADSSNVADPFYPLPSSFCFYQGNIINSSSLNCTLDSGGLANKADSRYKLSITRGVPNSGGGYLFTINAKWYEVTGNGQASESMVYRLYK